MTNEVIDTFATKEYRFLCWLDERQMNSAEGPVVKLSQNTLAQEYGSSPATVNNWIKSLRRSRCIETYKQKCGYIVTPIGKRAIEKMHELKDVITEASVNTDTIRKTATAGTYIDVFSGCGGLSLGLGWAGLSGVFAIEKDPMAYSTFEHNLVADDAPYRHFSNWPEWLSKKPHDIEDVLADENIETHLMSLKGKVTLLAGGPPCQGFSVAGARNGNDPRNLLVFKQIEMIDLLKPIFALIENVGGFGKKFVLRPSDNTTRSVAEEAIEKIKLLGYNVGKVTINAADFGVPQLRKRVLLFAVSEEFAGKVDIASLLQDTLAEIGVRQRKEFDLPTDRYVNVREAIGDLSGNDRVPDPEFSGYSTCTYQPARSSYQKLMRANSHGRKIPTCHRFNRHSEKLVALYNKAHETQPAGRLSKEFLYENDCHSNKRFVLDVKQPSSTLTTAPEELIHYKHPRVATLREMARLQSFPDDFEFYGRYTLNGPSRGVDVPRNAQIGNAIPPLVGRAIGLAINEIARMVIENDAKLDQYRIQTRTSI